MPRAMHRHTSGATIPTATTGITTITVAPPPNAAPMETSAIILFPRKSWFSKSMAD